MSSEKYNLLQIYPFLLYIWNKRIMRYSVVFVISGGYGNVTEYRYYRYYLYVYDIYFDNARYMYRISHYSILSWCHIWLISYPNNVLLSGVATPVILYMYNILWKKRTYTICIRNDSSLSPTIASGPCQRLWEIDEKYHDKINRIR